MIRKVFAWLVYGGSFGLRSYEKRCIEELGSILKPEAKLLLDSQLQWLDRYKRLANGTTVHFFSTQVANGQRLPAEIRFPRRDDELRFARVTCEFLDKRIAKINATFALECGELMSIRFSRAPLSLIAGSEFTVSSKLLHDPMRKEDVGDADLAQPTHSDDWLRAHQSELSAVRPPLGLYAQHAYLDDIDAQLPKEYLQWMQVTNGFVAFGVKIFGLDQIWSAPRPDGTFFIFGQSQTCGDLAVRAESVEALVYLLDSSDDRAKLLEGSLANFVELHASSS